MATAEDVLRVERSQIGYREAANGANKYGAAYGMDRVAWCAEFQWWCFREAGAPGLMHPKTAYTPTLYDWFRAQGRAGTSPQVGSLVFYNWPGDGVDRIQHVGMVEAFDATSITTIEGNTSDASAGNGGMVLRRRRARNSSIVGYGHPAYSSPPATAKDWFDMANYDDLVKAVRQVVREDIPQLVPQLVRDALPDVIRETTTPLPNRVDFALLGEDATDKGDTLFGFGMNADARSYETRQLVAKRVIPALEQLVAAAAHGQLGGGVTADQIHQIVTEALADLGPYRLVKETS
jgi:hypothetical protein